MRAEGTSCVYRGPGQTLNESVHQITPSIHPSLHPSVRPSVRPSFYLTHSMLSIFTVFVIFRSLFEKFVFTLLCKGFRCKKNVKMLFADLLFSSVHSLCIL